MIGRYNAETPLQNSPATPVSQDLYTAPIIGARALIVGAAAPTMSAVTWAIGGVVDWREPAGAVMSHGTAAVLRVLAGAEGPFSVRELARLTGVSATRARQVVARLAEHGLVTVDPSGGSHLVRLNHEHMAAQPSIALASLRARVLDQLRTEIEGWPIPAIHASLYGSAARGDGDTGSDIDLLTVHRQFSSLNEQEAWDDQLARAGARIRRWTGNWVGWFQVAEADLDRMVAAHEPIVTEWRRDAITLVGRPLVNLLRTIA